MNFRLLGPLVVGDGVPIRGARERKLLGLLLLEAPAAASRDTAARWVLGADCRADESGLHVAVSRLRRQLRDHNIEATIERTSGGLRLVTDFDTIDSVRFKGLLFQARTEAADLRDDRECLREALGLWRGEVLAGEDVPPHAAITELTELRIGAVEDAFAADSATEADPGRLAELLAWCRSNPHRERLWALAMGALYRDGRQVEALALFQEARSRLVDMLGLEPGPELVEMERRILCHDPTLAPVHVRRRTDFEDPEPKRGNLPFPSTSFVGRHTEVKDVAELVRTNRLVTLTGVGGVGKTRLALQVGAELAGVFPEGVWLVELAPVGDPGVVPDAAATELGVTAQADLGVTESLVRSLSGRRLLIILDNCEHVLDAAAGLVEALLARTSTVQVIATSREGLRVGAEQLWVVPPLGVQGGTASAAVELFVDRARAVAAGFEGREQAEAEAVEEICRRLDGIPLAIELAAARMVSLTAQDVRDRLGDRFRLLAGSRRGVERHQTLRHAVGWSYDLLDDIERTLLQRCSVFADGFDLAAAAEINARVDEYAVLDGLDSLVRKSLLGVEHVAGHARYGMLETIRQFAEDQLAATGTIEQVRDRHAAYFAEQALAYWNLWDGPDQRITLDWVDVELANLRAGFRWATDQGDLATAGAIAAHTAMMVIALERFEAVGWVEELLPAATAARLPQLPRLYTAASLCTFTGRPDTGARYAQTAQALEAEGSYAPFPDGFSAEWEAMAELHAGRYERAMEIHTRLAAQAGAGPVYGLGGQTMVFAMVGRTDDYASLAEEAVCAARDHGNPFFLAKAMYGLGLALARNEPVRALETFHQALAYAREHRQVLVEASIYRDAARVETVNGDIGAALKLYDFAIDVQHRSGNLANLAVTFASLSVCFDRLERHEIAATLYGITTHISAREPGIRRSVLGHLREVLGDAAFERCVAAGVAMEPADAVGYARDQIKSAGREFPPSGAR
jgi:predicted ATPase/DNA-binding SARP family transcriptional activator